MTDISQLKPSGLLPDSIKDERYEALDKILSRLDLIELDLVLVNIVDRAGEALLFTLAEQFHITGSEGWMLAETMEQKRNLVKNAITLHKQRGTVFAIKYVLSLLGMEGQIVEWWQKDPKGEPYHFEIQYDLGDRPLSDTLLGELDELVRRHKNVRSWVDYKIGRKSRAGIFLGAGLIGRKKGYLKMLI